MAHILKNHHIKQEEIWKQLKDATGQTPLSATGALFTRTGMEIVLKISL